MTKHEKIFTSLYERCEWGDNKNIYYKGSSGIGSTIAISRLYFKFLKNFISLNKIQSIVDLGCGDLKFQNKIYDNLCDIKYTGYDIYKDLINFHKKSFETDKRYNFIHLDIFEEKEKIIDGDLIIIKDVFQHWSNQEIDTFLTYLIDNKNFKYILITNSSDLSYKIKDIDTGEFRTLSIKKSPLKKFNLIGLLEFGIPTMQTYYNYHPIAIKLETSLFIKNL